MIQQFSFDELPSTQDKCFEILESGQIEKGHWCFVEAQHQTDGRGRRGRLWISEKGKSLSFSLGIQTEARDLSGLSLFVGLSLLKGLHQPDLKIKWPNDLLLSNAKVGGILVESRSQSDLSNLVMGVGLNLFDLQTQNYRGLRSQYCAIEMARCLVFDLESFFKEGFSASVLDFESVLWKRGELCAIDRGAGQENLTILGVDHFGRLRVRDESGQEESLLNAEIAYEII